MVIFAYHDDGFEPNSRPTKWTRMSSSTASGRKPKRPTTSAPSDTPQSECKRRRYEAADLGSARKRPVPLSTENSPQETPLNKRARVDASDVEMSDTLPFDSAYARSERRRRREKLAKSTVRGGHSARTTRTTYTAPSMASTPTSTPCQSSATAHSDVHSQSANIASAGTAAASYSTTAGSTGYRGDTFDFEASHRAENTAAYNGSAYDCPESTGFLPDNSPPEVIDVSTGAYNEKDSDETPNTSSGNPDGTPALQHWFLENGRLLLNITYNCEKKVAVFVDVPPY